jgi:SAM-dependent methyltransferase
MGCATYARNPFKASEVFGADLSERHPVNLERSHYFKVDARVHLPVQDGFFTSISAFDFIEHLNRSDGYPNSFITFLNEASRVLASDGILLCVTPAFPSPLSFQDPTHVNIITEGTVQYFLNVKGSDQDLDYGITCRFELVEQFWAGPFSLIRKPTWESQGLNLQILRSSLGIRNLRKFVSELRKPSHLVWVLRKV